MTKRHDELMRQTKDELIKHILELEKAGPPEIAERDVRIQSPAGPVHIFHGFVDDGTGPLVITGLQEDDWGHWNPYYSLKVNDQDLGKPEITSGTA